MLPRFKILISKPSFAVQQRQRCRQPQRRPYRQLRPSTQDPQLKHRLQQQQLTTQVSEQIRLAKIRIYTGNRSEISCYDVMHFQSLITPQ